MKNIEQETKDFILSDKQLKILNDRRNDRIEGNTKSYSWEEVKKSAQIKINNSRFNSNEGQG